MASEEDNQHIDVVAINLPAPSGWSKKFTPKKGGTPQRKDIVFTSPTGEEIKNKRQLDQYLKSHPGGPAASEFDWSTGDTPRRSARLSEKSKADVTVESLMPTKRQKKSSITEAQEKSNADAEEEATGEKDASAVESKESVEDSTVETKDAVNEGVIPEKPKSEDGEKRIDTSEEPSAAAPVGTETEKLNASVGESNNAITAVADAKFEESEKISSGVPSTEVDDEVFHDAIDETKEASDAGKETEDGKIDISVTASDDRNHSKGKEEEEKGKNPQQ